MTSSHPRQCGFGGLLLAAAALFPAFAGAQPLVRPLEVYATAGLGQVYLDETYPDHGEFGGGIRFLLTHRLGVEGDVLVFHPYWETESEHTRIGYVSFVRTWGPATGIVRPYFLGGIAVATGGGLNTTVWPNGGLGARVFIGNRYFLAPEVRGPIFRASIGGGIAFGSWPFRVAASTNASP